MKETKVKVSDLLETLKDNRDTHEREYRNARKNYKKAVRSALKEKLKVLETDWDFDKFEIYVSLPKPQSFADDYDTIIAQLEWEQEETVMLDQWDFQRFVQNKWEWSNQFAGTTMVYNH